MCVIATQREDGTWRKPVKVRPGYVAPEMMKKYVAPHKVIQFLTQFHVL